MQARSVAIVAALVGGTSWIIKLLIMAAQGGPDPDSVAESVAFVVGMLGVLAATAGAAAHLTRAATPFRRVLLSFGTVVAVAAIQGLGQVALTALPGSSWIQEEAIFGIFGVVYVTAALVALRRSQRPALP